MENKEFVGIIEESAVENPEHYVLDSGREAIDIIRDSLTDDELMGFYKANIFKYLLRAKKSA